MSNFVSVGVESLESRVTPAKISFTGTLATIEPDGVDYAKGINVLSLDSSIVVINNVSYQMPSRILFLTVLGTPKNDNINLEFSSKVCKVYGFDGNDSIVGSIHNDYLDGGNGDDAINGKGCVNGKNTIIGGSGNDFLSGIGTNYFDGGAGDDKISAGSGNDEIWGGAGNDTIWSGMGNDSVRGGAGNDYIEGSGGNDSLYGDDGDDKILGGDGNDLIVGGKGKDYLDGNDRTINEDRIWTDEVGVLKSAFADSFSANFNSDWVNGSKYKPKW
jgi:Ca2+-binding RTX toxin-like protein